MSTFSLEDFDRHIENLNAQLKFLKDTFDATDHNAPDWLATDLLSLRNKSGRLQDDMQRFRDRLDAEGLGTTKTSNKRLSLEGAKPSNSKSESYKCSPRNAPSSPPKISPRPRSATKSEHDYVAEHIDISEEVHRRMQESRLRRLMDSPSTSQKRKFDALEDTAMESAGDTADDRDCLAKERASVKRVRASGSFDPVSKRKENRRARGDSNDRNGDRADFKRRRIWSSSA